MSKKEYYNQNDAFKISSDPGYDNYVKNLKKEYEHFLIEEMKKNDLLNASYLKKKTQKELAAIYGVDMNTMFYRIKHEREALKIKCIEKGYARYVRDYKKISDISKYTENMIFKNGILKTVYVLGNDPEDIADALQIGAKSVQYAIDSALKEKEKLLNDLNVEDASSCIKVVKKYFPKQLIDIEKKDENYFKIINAVINSDEVLIKYFKEDKIRTTVCQETKKSMQYVNDRLEYGKRKIIELVKEYKKSNIIKEVPISQALLLDKKIKDLDNIGIVEKDKYIRFTLYYFPQLLEQIDKLPEHYFKYVDQFVNKEEIYNKFFVLGEKQVDIAKELNVTRQYINLKLLNSKKIVEKECIITKR